MHYSPHLGDLRPKLAIPAHLFASDPDGDQENADDEGPSQRPYETLTAIAGKLKLTIDKSYKKNHYDKMIEAALSKEGVVLIAWQHEDIPLLSDAGQPGISQSILTQTGTRDGKFKIPQHWPKGLQGARYDLVFVFDRPAGQGPIENFNIVPQMLLPGDAALIVND